MSEIRGLTLRHPWAWAFLAGKDVENRTWRPERMGVQVGSYLALHGGAVKFKDGVPALPAAYADEITDALAWIGSQGCALRPGSLPTALPEVVRPGIVAVGRLIDVRQDSPSPWAARGQWHWCLEVTPLAEAVPHRGEQGLWKLDPDAVAQVRELFREARSA